VSRWNGSTWITVAQFNNSLYALGAVTVGASTFLVAGGYFTFEYNSNQTLNSVARFNGTTWAPLGVGLSGEVHSIVGFNDGSGSALYVGGSYLSIANGGTGLGTVARWNGTAWASIGNLSANLVNSLAVFNDGTGAALYAGQANGSSGGQVFRWIGSSWIPLGTGLSNYGVIAMLPFDDGSGPALYVGGYFNTAGGIPWGPAVRAVRLRSSCSTMARGRHCGRRNTGSPVGTAPPGPARARHWGRSSPSRRRMSGPDPS
jgi:hypothetical protein